MIDSVLNDKKINLSFKNRYIFVKIFNSFVTLNIIFFLIFKH